MELKGPGEVQAKEGAPDDVHVRFLRASLAFAVIGGFTLAVSLPTQAALGRMNLSWVSHAQVHGHLQVVGFAALFIIGVAYKLAPRFGERPLAFPGLIGPTLWCIVVGLLLRTFGQPLADHAPFAAMLAAGALLELAGVAMFAACMIATLRGGVRRGFAPAVLLACGAAWLVAQAALGAWWLGGLAADGGTVLRADRNAVLVDAQLLGFALAFIAGVSTRAFPTFFARRPPATRPALVAIVALQTGVLAWIAGRLGGIGGWGEAASVGNAGLVVAGAAVVTIAAWTGWWRPPTRLRPASRPLAWLLQPALAFLTLAGVLMAWFALSAWLDGERPRVDEIDAVRHLFALGVVTMLIAGVAQLILPEFASERIVAPLEPWRGPVLAALLTAATLLRGAVPVLPVDLAGTTVYWLMSASGTLALAAVGLFAFFLLRAQRRHTAYLERVAAWRSRELPTQP